MNSLPKPQPRFIVAHNGARRGYAVPAILDNAGMLERFYTDACGNTGWARWLSLGVGMPWAGPKLAKLAARRVPEKIIAKTVTKFIPNVLWGWRKLWCGSDPARRLGVDMRHQLDLGDAAVRDGFGRATHLYSMLGEFPALLIAADERGLTVVTDVYILLSSDRLLAEERVRFPGWEEQPPDWQAIRSRYIKENVLFTRTDVFLCPSEVVRDDLILNWGVAAKDTLVVPCGVNARWLSLEPRAVRGRVLFVGTADLRKGIHYLAMAAEILMQRGRRYDIRVAGHVTEQVRLQPQCRHLTFLGRVPRDQIHKEFQQADVFTLPSLAEGSAGATYEALAAALPLVVTASAGSVIRDGYEGRIVAERDPVALADAIEEIIEKRALRDQFAVAARQRAAEYTWEHYGERLVDALRNI